MKTLLFSVSCVFLFACNAGKTFNKAEDAQDAGRQFIRASLDGDYEKARFYLLNDSVNLLLISKWQQGFDQMDRKPASNIGKQIFFQSISIRLMIRLPHTPFQIVFEKTPLLFVSYG